MRLRPSAGPPFPIRRFTRGAAALGAVLALGAARCGPVVLSVDDALVAQDGRRVTLTAFVEREGLIGLRSGVRGAPVSFSLDGRDLGTADAGEQGLARLAASAASIRDGDSFRATTVAGGASLSDRGRVYRFDPTRTVLVVDIDHTISDTEYETLLLEPRDDESDAISGSRKALQSLAADFEIIYLTARPRGLLDKTRDWLRDKKFPAGPVFTSHRTRDVIAQGEFRRRTLADLRRDWPNVLIGFGDRGSDARAQAANGMLTILVRAGHDDDEAPTGDLPGNTVVFQKWKHVARFFEANRSRLMNPTDLQQALRRGEIGRWPNEIDD